MSAGKGFTAGRQAASYFNANNRMHYALFPEAEHTGKEDAYALAVQLKENDVKGTAAWKQIEEEPIAEPEREMLERIKAAKVPADESLQKMMNVLVDQEQIDGSEQDRW